MQRIVYRLSSFMFLSMSHDQYTGKLHFSLPDPGSDGSINQSEESAP